MNADRSTKTAPQARQRVEEIKTAIASKNAELEDLRQQRTAEAAKLAAASRVTLRELGADIQAVEVELQALEAALTAASAAAQLEDARSESEALKAHHAAAVRCVQGKLAWYSKMAEALAAFEEAAREAQACADGASRHAASIRHHLPDRMRPHQGADVDRLLQSGFEAGVMQRLAFNAAIGRLGVHFPIPEMDMRGVPQNGDFREEHRKTVERLDSMLASWVRMAHETSPTLRMVAASTKGEGDGA